VLKIKEALYTITGVFISTMVFMVVLPFLFIYKVGNLFSKIIH